MVFFSVMSYMMVPLWEPSPYRSGEVCVSQWTWELGCQEPCAPIRVSHAQPGSARKAMWHFSLPHPVDPPSSGETAGVGCAATWVAVVVTGLGNPDLGGRCWRGMSPLLRGRRWSWYWRLSVTGLIWWGLPPCIALALDPNSWIGAGHFSSLELPKVCGAGRVWGYSQVPGWAPPCWSLPRWTRGSPPYA